MDFQNQLLELLKSQPNIYAKALANFLFREVVEDAHSKYNISQEDMKTMCKNAVDRAALLLSVSDVKFPENFIIYGTSSLEGWDEPNLDNEFAKDFYELMRQK